MDSNPTALGFLQLCADRRFHRPTMLAFEQATGLASDEYWIEARAGGAPSWDDNTRTARVAYRLGARHMGWAAHGDECRGFPGESDDGMRRKLARAARKRADEFPQAIHYQLFGRGSEIEVVRFD